MWDQIAESGNQSHLVGAMNFMERSNEFRRAAIMREACRLESVRPAGVSLRVASLDRECRRHSSTESLCLQIGLRITLKNRLGEVERGASFAILRIRRAISSVG